MTDGEESQYDTRYWYEYRTYVPVLHDYRILCAQYLVLHFHTFDLQLYCRSAVYYGSCSYFVLNPTFSQPPTVRSVCSKSCSPFPILRVDVMKNITLQQ